MRNLLTGILIGALGTIGSIAAWNNLGAKTVIVKPDNTGREDAFSVFRGESKLFNFYVYGNGFNIEVPDEMPNPHQIFYSAKENLDGFDIKLESGRLLENGTTKLVEYDMSDGSIARIMMYKDGIGEVFDRDGVLLETVDRTENTANKTE